MLLPYVKLIWITFFHINLHSIHFNGKAKKKKKVFNIFANLLKIINLNDPIE